MKKRMEPRTFVTCVTLLSSFSKFTDFDPSACLLLVLQLSPSHCFSCFSLTLSSSSPESVLLSHLQRGNICSFGEVRLMVSPWTRTTSTTSVEAQSRSSEQKLRAEPGCGLFLTVVTFEADLL